MPSVYQHTLSFDGDAFKIFHIFKDKPNVFFLDSSLRLDQKQFSYIGFSPFTTVHGREISSLKKVFEKYRIKKQGLDFPAGAVGYLAYDGSMFFGFYDTILSLDHQKKQLIISSLFKARIKDVLKYLKDFSGVIVTNWECPVRGSRSETTKQSIDKAKFDLKSNFTKEEYIKIVRQALEHIRRGDIYQINLSHQMKLMMPNWQNYIDAASIYQNLRQSFPSEFGAYFHDGKQVILSASPERFLKLHNATAQVKPMKGTRPRGKTKVQDRQLKEELLKSSKEIAELLMVTDLERNDLGRVCDYSTVKVKAMRTIESYKSVFQATSTVEGRLRNDCDQFDLLQATFPSGSVTGCPKIEAMKIIKKLEHGSRGLYTGALGYMSFSGDMDFNVMIRTMFLEKDQITFHVGGGIVADSKPSDEWQETMVKARPLMDTLRKSFL